MDTYSFQSVSDSQAVSEEWKWLVLYVTWIIQYTSYTQRINYSVYLQTSFIEYICNYPIFSVFESCTTFYGAEFTSKSPPLILSVGN
mgnify:CR=1 FL=1